jgi:hypothetical protein
MLPNKSKWFALLSGAVFLAAPAFAQEGKAILDILVRKGVITNEEA